LGWAAALARWLEQHMRAELGIKDRPRAEPGKASSAEIIVSDGANTAPVSTVSSETGLACLFRMGVQSGVYAEIGAVRRRNLIDGDRMPLGQLIDIAGEFGLEAKPGHFDWSGLLATPFSHPILLILDNSNAIVLLGMRRGAAGGAAEEVALSDPLFQEGEPFFLSREALERA
jgi:hypothetical protein